MHSLAFIFSLMGLSLTLGNCNPVEAIADTADGAAIKLTMLTAQIAAIYPTNGKWPHPTSPVYPTYPAHPTSTSKQQTEHSYSTKSTEHHHPIKSTHHHTKTTLHTTHKTTTSSTHILTDPVSSTHPHPVPTYTTYLEIAKHVAAAASSLLNPPLAIEAINPRGDGSIIGGLLARADAGAAKGVPPNEYCGDSPHQRCTYNGGAPSVKALGAASLLALIAAGIVAVGLM